MLDNFEKEMRSLFVTTRASEKAMRIIKEKRCVFLKGNPGDGKTTLAKHILEELMREKKMQPLQLLSLENFYGKVPKCSRIIIFLDNLFGERSVLKDEVHYFIIQKDFIKVILNNDENGDGNMLIATLRNDIYKECESRLSGIDFLRNSIVDISDMEHNINREELECFLSKYELKDTIVSADEIIKTRKFGNMIGIPQCIKILKNITQNKSKKNIGDIFEHPVKHLQEEIKLRINEKEHKTAVLIYILLCGGKGLVMIHW
ncbi:uncharacterized protein LOC134255458 [Saccostrea cucullata]|uniref:uncharacterized protein LOC134255458 n=1 Tax=Saccostrea cuccullata TaxID=36930 RepID=UPI002ED4F4EB